MTPRDEPASETDTALREWLTSMPLRLERLRYLLPRLTLHFSRESVADVERVVLGNFGDLRDVHDLANRERVELLVRYLGETYRRLAGGTWQLSDGKAAPQRFVLQPDVPAEPIDLLQLIVVALDRKSGKVFEQEYDRLREAAAVRAREDPGWTPRRIRIPGLDLPETPETPELKEWLLSMEPALRDWRKQFEAWGPWDSSPESLVRLQGLLLAELKLDEDRVVGDQFLLDGAVRYLGETLIRQAGGHWVYKGTSPDPVRYFRGRPYVLRENEVGEARHVIPVDEVTRLLEVPAPNVLRQTLEEYAQ